jgi:hypothetical protein
MRTFNFITIIVFISIIILIISCSSVTKESSTNFKVINLNLKEVKQEKNISEIFTDISLVKLETTPSSLIGEINKIFVTSNEIYISDGLSIYIFDLNGNFKKRLHKNGKGPGEYTGISDFLIDNNRSIEILNSGLQKVIRFDSSFNFVDEYKINRYAMNMALLDGRGRLFHCGNDASGGQYDKIVRFENGKLKEQFLKIDVLKSQYLHYRRFDVFSYHKNGVLITDAHNDTVYFFNNNSLEPRYVFDIGENAIPKRMYEKRYADVADFSLNHLKGSGYAYGIFNFIESDQTLFFHYDERIAIKESEYGKLKPTFVHFNKSNNTSDTFYHITDDVNFAGSPKLNEYTVFYSQPNGLVAYAIQAFSFLEMYNAGSEKSTTTQVSHKDYPAETFVNNTKPTDNLIIVIGKLK